MIEHLHEAQRLVREHDVPPVIAADVVQEYVLLATEGVVDDLWPRAVRQAWHRSSEQRRFDFAPWPTFIGSQGVRERVEFEQSMHTESRTPEEAEFAWLSMDRVQSALDLLPEPQRRATVEHYGLEGTARLTSQQRADKHGTTIDQEKGLVARGRQLIERNIEPGGIVPEREEEPVDIELLKTVAQLDQPARRVAEARIAGYGPADTARITGLSLAKVERTLRKIRKTIQLPPPNRETS